MRNNDRNHDMTPTALTIAGSDPTGGAGLQADLKVFHQHGVYGMSVVTLITVQNTQEVSAVEVLHVDLVLKQLAAVLDDIPPKAAKTGALGSAEIVDALAKRAERFSFPLVIDPVMISKHGSPLLDPEAVEIFRRYLIPHCYLLTPNIPEAEQLAEQNIVDVSAMEKAAKRISLLGPKAVLVKGGHLPSESTDVLAYDGEVFRLPHPRIETKNTHGTGCALSAAITAHLARGAKLMDAVKAAKAFISEAIRTNPGLGHGAGPINLHTRARV